MPRQPTKRQVEKIRPTKKELKKEWEKRVQASQWRVDPTFRHPSGVQTITQTDALHRGTPRLNRTELGTLQYEQRRSQKDVHRRIHLYNLQAVLALLDRRNEALGLPLELDEPTTTRDDHLHPKDPPLIDHDYIPPLDAHQDDPAPKDIIWEGEHIDEPNLLLEDALLLYCLEKRDVQRLTAQSKWLDLKTVAVLALRLHGGLRKHNEIIVERRQSTREFIEEELHRTKFKSERQPSGRYSKYLEDVLKRRPIDVAGPSTTMEPVADEDKSIWRRQVKQFAPLRRTSEDEWSNDCSWSHYRSRELIEERDLVP
ncbi:unnamed protein product [Peniophora sp. CBMAI 1063]|nr:unnamed protein product [Peniophora sp. CBMAI 1063]